MIKDHRNKKSNITWEVIYTCSYTSGHLIPTYIWTRGVNPNVHGESMIAAQPQVHFLILHYTVSVKNKGRCTIGDLIAPMKFIPDMWLSLLSRSCNFSMCHFYISMITCATKRSCSLKFLTRMLITSLCTLQLLNLYILVIPIGSSAI